MRAVDTNVLIRLITRDDDRQVADAEAFVAKGVWISLLVLAETTWVLGAVYNLDHAAIATVIEMLLAHQSLTFQDPDVIAAALDHYHSKPALGFSDCLILEIASKAGHLPLGTFDKTLGKLTGAQKL